jgi:hypothetical protein
MRAVRKCAWPNSSAVTIEAVIISDQAMAEAAVHDTPPNS